MSPGATFERVYNELKRQLAEGLLPPGTPIEPAQLTDSLAASITPIRDALHRLTGERLVEAPHHNGFIVPRPTEAALRDLYAWNAQILGLAARRLRSAEAVRVPGPFLPEEIATATAALFTEIARISGSQEHVRAVEHLNDRLAPFRRMEAHLFDDGIRVHDAILTYLVAGDRARLTTLLDRYHRSRVRRVPELLHAAADANGSSVR